MCGIFGVLVNEPKDYSIHESIEKLARLSTRRGTDASGLVFRKNKQEIVVKRTSNSLTKLIKSNRKLWDTYILGHSRMVTNAFFENQPLVREGAILLHNGIVVNDDEVWGKLSLKRTMEIDSEVIIGVFMHFLKEGLSLDKASNKVFELCKGAISVALLLPNLGKLVLMSNNGSLYTGSVRNSNFFASERYSLESIGCTNIKQVKKFLTWDIPISDMTSQINEMEIKVSKSSNLKRLKLDNKSAIRLNNPKLKRCIKCVLPNTMPFIIFDENGLCNYCHHYEKKINLSTQRDLLEIIEIEPKIHEDSNVIVPLSGGRDSCFTLYYVKEILGLKPIAFTYDWGMLSDLGRRNISLMCGELEVEHILVAADIDKKRRNIRRNLEAWLQIPNLGMLNILTAGDKQFYRLINDVRRETGIKCHIWGVNPLEVTHFKSGFLGLAPHFAQNEVYRTGWQSQIEYQKLRLKEFVRNTKYLNSSLWDTFSGEYFRSIQKKSDYYHLFDYVAWDESLIMSTLDRFGWERAQDTNSTWRIGDGSAAFYNYVYFTIAGFSEHDTFRSNQIREGLISREEALRFVAEENQPRIPNIRWYLDIIGMDFDETITKIESIPKLY